MTNKLWEVYSLIEDSKQVTIIKSDNLKKFEGREFVITKIVSKYQSGYIQVNVRVTEDIELYVNVHIGDLNKVHLGRNGRLDVLVDGKEQKLQFR